MLENQLSDERLGADDKPGRDENVQLEANGSQNWGEEKPGDPHPWFVDRAFPTGFEIVQELIENEGADEGEGSFDSHEEDERRILPS